jgi:hypothetical protein
LVVIQIRELIESVIPLCLRQLRPADVLFFIFRVKINQRKVASAELVCLLLYGSPLSSALFPDFGIATVASLEQGVYIIADLGVIIKIGRQQGPLFLVTQLLPTVNRVPGLFLG